MKPLKIALIFNSAKHHTTTKKIILSEALWFRKENDNLNQSEIHDQLLNYKVGQDMKCFLKHFC